mgnify:CR=1 FL=1
MLCRNYWECGMDKTCGHRALTGPASFTFTVACILLIPAVGWGQAKQTQPEWTSVDASGDYTCATTRNSNIYCWGDRPWSQQGNEVTWRPQKIESSVPFATVVTSWSKACGLSDSGRAYCWGKTKGNRLGNPNVDPEDDADPIPVSGVGRFHQLDTDSEHSCAISTSEEVYCWGKGFSGQLGPESRFSAAPVPVPLSAPAREVVTGDYFSCALDEKQTIWCWGRPFGQRRGGDPNLRKVGDGHFDTIRANDTGLCALRDTSWRCWPDEILKTNAPTDSATFAKASPPMVDIELGRSFGCGLTESGEAHCWGENGNGQLGDRTRESRPRPRSVATDASFIDLGVGREHACGVTDQGRLMCWGDSRLGRLGFRTFPRLTLEKDDRPEDATRIKLMVGGRDDEGCTASSGWFNYCERGDFLRDQVLLPSALNPAKIAIGAQHDCGINPKGTFCAGRAAYGQLGHGSRRPSEEFVKVIGSEEAAYQALSSGPRHTCGLTKEGNIDCWGYNGHGELGSEAGQMATEPTPVTGDRTYQQVVAGRFHTCGLTDDGAATCWGDNRLGQLGDGSTSESATPVAVADGHRFDRLSTFGAHTCGITTGGDLYCWGVNDAGQLGSGDTKQRSEPQRVDIDAAVTQIVTSRHHTCALTKERGLYCWGIGISTPHRVASGDVIAGIRIGGYYNEKVCMVDQRDVRLGCIDFNNTYKLRLTDFAQAVQTDLDVPTPQVVEVKK